MFTLLDTSFKAAKYIDYRYTILVTAQTIYMACKART